MKQFFQEEYSELQERFIDLEEEFCIFFKGSTVVWALCDASVDMICMYICISVFYKQAPVFVESDVICE